MKESFMEDDEIYEDEEDMEDDDLETDDVFEDEDEDLKQISSYWKDDQSSGGYGRRKKSNRYNMDSDY